MSDTDNSGGMPYFPPQTILFPDDGNRGNQRGRKRHVRTLVALLVAGLLIAGVLGEVVHLANKDTPASVSGQE